MFSRLDVTLNSRPVCTKAIDDLIPEDFQYFDKDGFELNQAEQKYYRAMGHPIHYPILNHTCWQEPWYTITHPTLFLDHAMQLQRCSYSEAARAQLESEPLPQSKLLLQIKPKWGYDFDLNSVNEDGAVYEVLHVEYDSNDYNQYREKVLLFEQTVKHLDWEDAAKRIWQLRDDWQNLKGFDQNHWKAQYILGWQQSEYLEKVI